MLRHRGSHGVHLSPALLAFAKAHRDHRTLSVYVSGGMTNPADRRRWQIVLKHEIAHQRRAISRRSRGERAAFEVCVSLLLDHLPSEATVHATAAWACFVGETGSCIAEPLAFAVSPVVVWQVGIRIAPCLAAAAHPRAIVVVADRQHATLFRLANTVLTKLEQLDVEPDIEVGPHMGSTPRQGFHPGKRGETQRDAGERFMRESRSRHAAATAARAAALAGTDADIVVGGVTETALLVSAQLPASFAGRTTRTDTIRASMPQTDIMRFASEALRTLTAERQLQLATALIDDVGQSGHAATGVLDVIHALEQRAVDHLLVSPTLVEREPEAVDSIVQEALFEGAEAETAIAQAADLVDRTADGVLARLRFPIPPARRKVGRRGGRHAIQLVEP